LSIWDCERKVYFVWGEKGTTEGKRSWTHSLQHTHTEHIYIGRNKGKTREEGARGAGSHVNDSRIYI